MAEPIHVGLELIATLWIHPRLPSKPPLRASQTLVVWLLNTSACL